MTRLIVEDWGLIPYQAAWERQDVYFNRLLTQKIEKRKAGLSLPLPSYLVFCEHPHVITMGKSGADSHLVRSEAELKTLNIDFYRINRGGDVTYHGPGQVVGYLIFDIESLYQDLHRFLRDIEDCIMQLLQSYHLVGERLAGYTGVWLDAQKQNARKICAIGIRASQWISMHGFALNVNTDLSFFGTIVPCGIKDKAVTSLAAELGQRIDEQEVKGELSHIFQDFYAANLKTS